MIETLESLSGYRHAFELNDPNAANNPVNYSHLILTVGGRKYHVLSRICDAGIDYTQRTNKLAHHVVLTDAELTKGGPACVLSQPGFCVTKWEGEPRVIQQGRTLDPRDRAPQVCRAWQAATGDAGWGAVLAESFLEQPPRTVSVIFKPGQDLLPLVVESLALIPEERRWEVTFSTYFTRLPAGIDCHWRFLLEGSPEAKAVRANPHLKVVDLTARLGHATGGNLMDVARNGAPAAAIKPTTSPPSKSSASPPPPNRPSQALNQNLDSESDARDAPADPGSISLRSEPPPIRGRFTPTEAPTPSPVTRRRRRKRSIITPVVTAIAVLAAIGIGVLAAIAYPSVQSFLSRIFKEDTKKISITQADPASPTNELQPTPPTPERTAAPKTTQNTVPTPPPEQKVDQNKKNAGVATNKNAATPTAPTTKTKAKTDIASVTPLKNVTLDPFTNLRNDKNYLELPRPNQKLASPTDGKALPAIDTGGSKCQLHLVGVDSVFSQDERVELQDISANANGFDQGWCVHYKDVISHTDMKVGKFTITKGVLLFSWEPQTPQHIGRLQYCRLRISCSDRQIVVQLLDPSKLARLPSRLSGDPQIAFNLDRHDLPLPGRLNLHLEFRNPTPTKNPMMGTTLSGKPMTFTFVHRCESAKEDADIDPEFLRAELQMEIRFVPIPNSADIGLTVHKRLHSPTMDLTRESLPLKWNWTALHNQDLRNDAIGPEIEKRKRLITSAKASSDYQRTKRFVARLSGNQQAQDHPDFIEARKYLDTWNHDEELCKIAQGKWRGYSQWRKGALELIKGVETAHVHLELSLRPLEPKEEGLVLLRSDDGDGRLSVH